MGPNKPAPPSSPCDEHQTKEDDSVGGAMATASPPEVVSDVAERRRDRVRWYLAMALACLVVVVAAIISSRAAAATNALLIIDVQNCFTPGGTLAVDGGDDVVPVINRLRVDYADQFDVVVMTKDWHCRDHVSFASQYAGRQPYQTVNLTYISSTGELCASDVINNSHTVSCSQAGSSSMVQLTQVLWPDHCVMNTSDANLKSNLTHLPSDIVVLKGYHCQVDSYSAFFDNGHMTSTELQTLLLQHGVTTLYVVGLATDYCVYYTAKDGISLGFKTYVVLDATRGVSPVTTSNAVADMLKSGISVINSTEVSNTFQVSGATSLLITPCSVLFAASVAVCLTCLSSILPKMWLV